MYFLDELHSAVIPQLHSHPEAASISTFPFANHMLESIKRNFIALQMHLGPNPSYSPHHVNFRVSEQQ